MDTKTTQQQRIATEPGLIENLNACLYLARCTRGEDFDVLSPTYREAWLAAERVAKSRRATLLALS